MARTRFRSPCSPGAGSRAPLPCPGRRGRAQPGAPGWGAARTVLLDGTGHLGPAPGVLPCPHRVVRGRPAPSPAPSPGSARSDPRPPSRYGVEHLRRHGPDRRRKGWGSPQRPDPPRQRLVIRAQRRRSCTGSCCDPAVRAASARPRRGRGRSAAAAPASSRCATSQIRVGPRLLRGPRPPPARQQPSAATPIRRHAQHPAEEGFRHGNRGVEPSALRPLTVPPLDTAVNLAYHRTCVPSPLWEHGSSASSRPGVVRFPVPGVMPCAVSSTLSPKP